MQSIPQNHVGFDAVSLAAEFSGRATDAQIKAVTDYAVALKLHQSVATLRPLFVEFQRAINSSAGTSIRQTISTINAQRGSDAAAKAEDAFAREVLQLAKAVQHGAEIAGR